MLLCYSCTVPVPNSEAECRGGVLTAAYAFHGTTWIDRIQAASCRKFCAAPQLPQLLAVRCRRQHQGTVCQRQSALRLQLKNVQILSWCLNFDQTFRKISVELREGKPSEEADPHQMSISFPCCPLC